MASYRVVSKVIKDPANRQELHPKPNGRTAHRRGSIPSPPFPLERESGRVGEWGKERVCVCELVVCELGDFQNVHVHRGQPPSNHPSPGLRLRCSTGNLTGAALPVL